MSFRFTYPNDTYGSGFYGDGTYGWPGGPPATHQPRFRYERVPLDDSEDDDELLLLLAL